ncbi:hypothetical protein LI053_06210 [Clostridium perfringens]|uniref:hypothetical protein n=2 Tax=Clostridium perfringens TaxID=1502 RepID=UPI0013E3C864|nr:hypothetical protein [Clostridium perfringens]MCX0385049.1 hypothetical protein [Clostridium perfringens]MDT7929851.1 hypothetical protein [Clostridium perfringens]MDT7954693.1 hypothetical protein [Clostridium perfringens]NGT56158.1 hypothetical protein [Clostridium perfringens]
MYIDIENRNNAIGKFKEAWEEFRQELGQNIFNYKELEKAKEYTFLKVLDDVLQYKENNDDLQESFINLHLYYSFCRATKKSDNESRVDINFDRFLPKEKFIKEDNRFSPKGIEYLYLACKLRFGKERNYKYIEDVALKEVRAEKGNIYGICKFNIPESVASIDKKVINLTIADNKTFEKIESELWEKDVNYLSSNCNNFISKRRKVDKCKVLNYYHKVSRRFCLDVYFKILSSELFKPVENAKSKEFEYAPFHCMAYYFKQLGFEGIIYKSTVCNNGYGKDIVLFNKNLAKPFGDIRFVNSDNEDI